MSSSSCIMFMTKALQFNMFLCMKVKMLTTVRISITHIHFNNAKFNFVFSEIYIKEDTKFFFEIQHNTINNFVNK